MTSPVQLDHSPAVPLLAAGDRLTRDEFERRFGWVGSDLNRRRAERHSSTGRGAHAQAKYALGVLEDLVATAAASDADLGARAVAHLQRALKGKLTELPEAEALARLILGRLYLQRGDSKRAMLEAERALLLCRTVPGLGKRDLRRARELRDRITAASDPR